MARRSAPKSPFVVTLALTAAACGGSVEHGGSGGSGAIGCPSVRPENGAPCPVAGQSCSYSESDACGNTQSSNATCQSGMKWKVVFTTAGGCNPPPPPVDVCPSAEPSAGSYCNVVESKYCEYPTACCPSNYQCVGNVWQQTISVCNPPALVCPDAPPAQGSACDPCAAEPAPCTWDCADAGVSGVATCAGGAWQVSVTPCTGPGGDAGV